MMDIDHDDDPHDDDDDIHDDMRYRPMHWVAQEGSSSGHVCHSEMSLHQMTI